jgi:hypothetical protein
MNTQNTSAEHLSNVSDAVSKALQLLETMRWAYDDLDQLVPHKLVFAIANLVSAKEELELLSDSLLDEQLSTLQQLTKENLRTQLSLIESCKNADKEYLETITPFLKNMFDL